ncbi:MAG: DegV family protein [Clostridia bacterium]|nr:DegV family protein [Clostridia bacterium]
MIKLFVDSGSSIKQEEKERYDVEILPLKIMIENREYLDGVDLSMEDFYHYLIDENIFPKTSLPSPGDTREKVMKCVEEGYDVIILSLSSGLSGTFNMMRTMFADVPSVCVIDTKTAVGGIRILVEEVNKYRDKSLDFVRAKLSSLIYRIRVIAIPDTLAYLHKGGRLSRSAWVAGSIMQVKPLIIVDSKTDGGVKVVGKALGKKNAMRSLAEYLIKENCDTDYSIVPSYTYNSRNLDELISLTDDKYKSAMTEYDNLDPAIACHWGPGAFGYIFVSKE